MENKEYYVEKHKGEMQHRIEPGWIGYFKCWEVKNEPVRSQWCHPSQRIKVNKIGEDK